MISEYASGTRIRATGHHDRETATVCLWNGIERRAVGEDGLMTISEAIDFLKVSRTTLYRLMREGQIAYALIGTSRRLLRAAIVSFITTRVHRVVSEC